MGRRRKEPLAWKFGKIISVICEGTVTEPSYIDALRKLRKGGKISIEMQGNKSNKKIIDKANKIRENSRTKLNEIWIVIDKNDRSERQLNELYNFEATSGKTRIALSNPYFELWLLFHYEDAAAVRDSQDVNDAKYMCMKALAVIDGWGDYRKTKRVPVELITEERIRMAVARAKKHEATNGKRWPKIGSTTFHKLVESYLDGPS